DVRGATRLRLGVALWHGGLPVDVLPAEGILDVSLGGDNFAWPLEPLSLFSLPLRLFLAAGGLPAAAGRPSLHHRSKQFDSEFTGLITDRNHREQPARTVRRDPDHRKVAGSLTYYQQQTGLVARIEAQSPGNFSGLNRRANQ